MIATPTKAKPDLHELASRIDREHAACEAAVRSALAYARACGQALLEVKQALQYGEFERWILRHVKVSPRQARNYMTLAKNWDKIEELSRKRASELGLENLSIRAALRLLTQDLPGWKYVDLFCPACGERMVVTSRFYVTCPACWDCRLYPNPKAASMLADDAMCMRAYRVQKEFQRLADPFQQAEVLVALLAMLDETQAVPEAIRLLTERRKTSQRQRAAKVLAKLCEPIPEEVATR